MIPCCERLIDRTSLQVSACWATSCGVFHCSMLVGMSCWDVPLVRLACLTGGIGIAPWCGDEGPEYAVPLWDGSLMDAHEC